MPRFHVGQLIVGNSDNQYHITGTNVICVVRAVYVRETKQLYRDSIPNEDIYRNGMEAYLLPEEFDYDPDEIWDQDDIIVSVADGDSHEMWEVMSSSFDPLSLDVSEIKVC